jgi:hypothetical protein
VGLPEFNRLFFLWGISFKGIVSTSSVIFVSLGAKNVYSVENNHSITPHEAANKGDEDFIAYHCFDSSKRQEWTHWRGEIHDHLSWTFQPI